ncbi:MAG: xanthine dehydrogenase family protein molybdopterin-binding subunit [Anaerolineaceae bacterium]|nr:xanthine dehydrogenase family protein molybdopterin-binding subunit [Anaerolineaceae bacterium]
MTGSIIGRSVPRIDGEIKVSGRAKYVTDLSSPGMLYAKILFSDRPHAKILRVDTSKAEAMDGVRAVITAANAPKILYGLYVFDRYIFARDGVRHIGEPIAAVAAVSKKIAIAAVKLIEVEYEDLPAVFSIEDALKTDAPVIHADIKSYSGISAYVKYGNVCMDASVGMGDIQKGFAEADYIFENVYRTSPMHQSSIEPHACLAEYDLNGKLTVWTGTQQLSVCHSELSKALGLPQNQVRVIPVWLGGGFGGKLKSLFEPITALLAKAANAPVKLELTREEEFTVTHPRANFTIRIKTGVKKNGKLVAREVDMACDVGAYSDHALGEVTHAMSYATGPYNIPNVKVRGRAVYTNNPDWGCMRGYGGQEITLPTEGQLDVIARALNMDPVELRRMNLAKEGEIFLTTQPLRSVHIEQTMDQAIKASHYYEKKGKMGANRGIGLANSMLNAGFLSSSAFVRLNEDGTVSVITAITDLGTGNLTVLCQIVAETLGVPVETVTIAAQDSDVSPYDTGSIASRTVFDAGNAVYRATEDVRHQVIAIAREIFECEPADIQIENGVIFDRNQPLVTRTIADIAGEAIFLRTQGPILGRGSTMPNPPHEHSIGNAYFERPSASFTFATHVAEVEVDPETGQVKVLNYTACHDVGQVMNKAGIEGQVEGGVVQGIGYGLYEELIVKDGKILNPNFTDYRVPTAMDVSFKTHSDFVEIPEELGPYGAKGVGEIVMIPPPAAIANAILDAIGVHVSEIPISPERLYWAIQKQKNNPRN